MFSQKKAYSTGVINNLYNSAPINKNCTKLTNNLLFAFLEDATTYPIRILNNIVRHEPDLHYSK